MTVIRIMQSPIPLDYATPHRRVNGFAQLGIGGVIFALHGIIIFAISTGFTANEWINDHYGLIVLGLTTLLATVAYAFLSSQWVRFKPWPYIARRVCIYAITLAAGFVTFWSGVIIGSILFGT